MIKNLKTVKVFNYLPLISTKPLINIKKRRLSTKAYICPMIKPMKKTPTLVSKMTTITIMMEMVLEDRLLR